MKEKVDNLERRINTVESSVQPLLAKLDNLADKIAANTIQQTKTEASHHEVTNMLARFQKRQDKLESEQIETDKILAEYKPTMKQWSNMGQKMMVFGCSMLAIGVAALILVAKMFIGTDT